MSALVPEPPALVRSPEEQQHSGHEPGHVLAQLSAALDSPNVRALEVKGDAAWDMGVVMSTGFIPGATSTALALCKPCARTGGANVCQSLGRGKE